MRAQWKTRFPALHYLDTLLWLEVVLAGAALWISSHGVHLFFTFVMPSGDMAIAATIVLSLGIPVMEAAWVGARARYQEISAALSVANDRDRPRLFAERAEVVHDREFFFRFMMALLVVEVVAQYFQGQAIFYPNVRDYFADSDYKADLLFLAEQELWGRVLAGVYLGSITAAVFFIIRAAAERFAVIRRKVQHAGAKATHEARLQLQVTQLQAQIADEQHSKTNALSALRSEFENMIAQIKAEAQAALAQSSQRAAEALEALRTEHATIITGLQAELQAARQQAKEAQTAKLARETTPLFKRGGGGNENLRAQILAAYREAYERDGTRIKARAIAESIGREDKVAYIEQVISRNRAAIEAEVDAEKVATAA